MSDVISTILSDHPRILVLGDAMLDRYTWGHAERVSPEAPVLVLRTDEREVRLGGAASVAMLLAALEAHVSLATVIGDDHDGRTVQRLLSESRIDPTYVITDPDRPTTTKERFLGRADQRQPHQMLRVDTESRDQINETQVNVLLNRLVRTHDQSAEFGRAKLPLSREVAAFPCFNGLEEAMPSSSERTTAQDPLVGSRDESGKLPLEQFDAVLISDYGKGVCTAELLTQVIKHCRDAAIPVLVDPARGAGFDLYRQATLIKPNRLEAELVLGRTIDSPSAAIEAAQELRDRYQFECVVITLDRDGLVFATNNTSEHLPIAEQPVCDITGAGDTVLAILGLGLASTNTDLLKNGDWHPHCQTAHPFKTPPQVPVPVFQHSSFGEIAKLANRAAGIQVAHAGVTPITRAQLQQASIPRSVKDSNPRPQAPHKLITLETAVQLAAQYHSAGKTIVFTNGCFDLLHVGHVETLDAAAESGDVLFVAINSDASVRRLKGPGRPVIHEHDRARMLCGLACVDHVLILGDATPHRMLEAIRPDVLVKGGTTAEIIGREVVERYGGSCLRTDEITNRSTTQLVCQIRETSGVTQ